MRVRLALTAKDCRKEETKISEELVFLPFVVQGKGTLIDTNQR